MCVGGHAHQLSKVHVQLHLDLLLVFALVSVLNGLDRMWVHNDMNPLHAINKNFHHVYSVLAFRIDL